MAFSSPSIAVNTNTSGGLFSFPYATSTATSAFNIYLDDFIGTSITSGTISNIQTHVASQLRHMVTSTGGNYVGSGFDITNTSAGEFVIRISGTDHDINSFRVIPQHNIKQQIQQKIKNNLLIKVNSSRTALNTQVSVQEQCARNTLRDMLTEQEWRRYVTNGFIMLRGSSGHWYQIFANRGVNVYKDGKPVHYICIHSDAACPPTDHVINMKILIEMDESLIWKNGNIRQYYNNKQNYVESNENIVDYYRKVKQLYAVAS